MKIVQKDWEGCVKDREREYRQKEIPEGEDSKDCKRERSDVRKMDGVTQTEEREITETE